jgi:predicted 3-demethylubiquinone-9 3-methyltransferase (glyoxalase superfamily)
MPAISKITPFLWFESRAAEEAANFYVSIFENSRILSLSKVAAGPAKDGALVEFELEGQKFAGVDGGPMFSFTPAVSFVVTCDSQEEIDYFWDKLSEGGMEAWAGWLNDKFGLSWQVVPSALGEIMSAAPKPVMERLLTMTKIDIDGLRQEAAAG